MHKFTKIIYSRDITYSTKVQILLWLQELIHHNQRFVGDFHVQCLYIKQYKEWGAHTGITTRGFMNITAEMK